MLGGRNGIPCSLDAAAETSPWNHLQPPPDLCCLFQGSQVSSGQGRVVDRAQPFGLNCLVQSLAFVLISLSVLSKSVHLPGLLHLQNGDS